MAEVNSFLTNPKKEEAHNGTIGSHKIFLTIRG